MPSKVGAVALCSAIGRRRHSPEKCPPMSEIPHVCSFETRRGEEMASLIRRAGGEPVIVPSMREVPLENNTTAFEFADQLFAGKIDVVIFLTGVGAKALFDVWETRFPREQWIAALDRCIIGLRGPKPAVVMREIGVHVDFRAPEPNTWKELLTAIDAHGPANWLAGKRIAIQEYGRMSLPLHEGLTERGAQVLPIPVYRWELPEEIGPLTESIHRTIAGDFQILLFTTANQLVNVLTIADQLGFRDQWLTAARKCFIGSIGPTATETLTEHGLPPQMEPTHSKMGHLARESIAAWLAASP